MGKMAANAPLAMKIKYYIYIYAIDATNNSSQHVLQFLYFRYLHKKIFWNQAQLDPKAPPMCHSILLLFPTRLECNITAGRTSPGALFLFCFFWLPKVTHCALFVAYGGCAGAFGERGHKA